MSSHDAYEKKQELQHTLNKRNTLVVEQQLKELDLLVRAQEKRIDGLMTLISTLANRLNTMEQQQRMQLVMAAGRGPTSR